MKEGQRRTRRCSAKDQEGGYGTGPWMRLGDRSQRWTDNAGSDRSQGGGHAGTHGPHAPPGKHGGPARLEHGGLGVPVLLNMGARQIPGRQARQCASCVVLPPQNHQALALGGEGLACP